MAVQLGRSGSSWDVIGREAASGGLLGGREDPNDEEDEKQDFGFGSARRFAGQEGRLSWRTEAGRGSRDGEDAGRVGGGNKREQAGR